jgi:hypothetical protein
LDDVATSPQPSPHQIVTETLPRLENEDVTNVHEHENHLPEKLQILESDGDYEPSARKARRFHTDDSDVDGVEETVDDHHNLRKPLVTTRYGYMDPLDIAEGRGNRYRNISGNVLDPESQAVAKEIVGDIRLETSKSPILDALVYCALKGWGMRIVKNEGDDIRIHVDDFQKYYSCSAVICSKEHPTEDQSSRIKALRRWFPDFPAKQDEVIVLNRPFEVHVQRPASKDNKPKKMRDIIKRMQAFMTSESRGLKRQREDDD